MRHQTKCGCWSCTEYRRDNARLRKFQKLWYQQEVKDALYLQDFEKP